MSQNIDHQIQKQLIISTRLMLYRSPYLVRTCNYGYNAFIKKNKLIVLSFFRPTLRPIDIRSVAKLVEQRNIKLQCAPYNNDLYFANLIPQNLKKYVWIKQIQATMNNGKIDISLRNRGFSCEGWYSQWQGDDLQAIQNWIFDRLMGRMRIKLMENLKIMIQNHNVKICINRFSQFKKKQLLEIDENKEYTTRPKKDVLRNITLFQLLYGFDEQFFIRAMKKQFDTDESQTQKFIIEKLMV